MDITIKNAVLDSMLERLSASKEKLLRINQEEIRKFSGDEVLKDCMKISEVKFTRMLQSLKEIKQIEDPEGKLIYKHSHKNGLRIENKTVPFGKILIIYESRPDVTIEAAASAFKAGNKVGLKGGSESAETNKFLVGLWKEALEENHVDKEFIEYLDFNRIETKNLIITNDLQFDLLIPRGGESLLKFIRENSSIPCIESGRGNNFVYLHNDADCTMACDTILNAKTQSISVCNAIDKVLVHRGFSQGCLSKLIKSLHKAGVEIFADEEIRKGTNHHMLKEITNEELWKEEFLALKIVIGRVESIDEAIQKINKYSYHHSAAIITESGSAAEKFMQEVDSAAVYHNASTRFTDGGEFGLGGEMAISTVKLHARGPLGLQHLVTNKWFIYGNGQVRK